MSLLTDIESFFEKAGAWFSKLFGAAGKDIQIAITNIAPLVTEAQTLIADISLVLVGVDTANPSAVLTAIESFLTKASIPLSVVSSFLTANTGVPFANVLNNAATLALSYTKGAANVVLKDLQLAVQLAYAAFSAKNPTTTGKQTVANISKPNTVAKKS